MSSGLGSAAAVAKTRWRWFGLAVVVAGALVLARPSLMHAQLIHEDGTVLFARCFQELRPQDFAARYAGYASLVPALVASLLCRLPVSWIPLAFVSASVAIVVWTQTQLLRRRWDGLTSMPIRVAVVAALAWLPVGNFAISGQLIFSSWNLLLATLLQLLAPIAPGWCAVTWRSSLLAVLAWTNPLTVCLVPVAVARAWQGRGARMYSAAFLVSVVAYLGFGIEYSGVVYWKDTFQQFVPHLLDRIGFETFLGSALAQQLHGHGASWIVHLAGGGVLLGVVVALRGVWPGLTGEGRRLLLAWWFSGVAVLGASLLTRGWQMQADEVWGQRYLMMARWSVIIATVWAVAHAAPRRVGVGLLVVWWVVLWAGKGDLYRVPGISTEFRRFLAELQSAESERGGRLGITAELPRGDFPIRIVAR